MQVVIGANKGLGHAIACQLAERGREVTAIARGKAEGAFALPAGVMQRQVDARDPSALRAACAGASVLYHCANVGYSQWDSVHPVLMRSVLQVAQELRAVVVFPGNNYGYGRLQHQPAREDHPLAAHTRKGKLRNRLEEQLLKAHAEGRIRAVIPRLPDFYGPRCVNGLMAPIFEGALSGRKALWPASLDQPHDLVFVEDAAAAAVRLAENAACHGRAWHVPGPGPLTGREFIHMAFAAAGTEPRVGVLPGWLLRIVGLFQADAGELVELLYEFSEPMRLDGSRFAAAHPEFRYTPHAKAVAQTVQWFRTRAAGSEVRWSE